MDKALSFGLVKEGVFMKSFVFLPLILSFLISSCAKIKSEDIDQKDIVTDYQIFYDVKSEELTARATFLSQKGFSNFTRIKLSGESFVSLNGQKLKLEGPIEKNFSLEYSGRLKLDSGVEEAVLVYQNNDGEVFENKIIILEEPTFKVIPKVVGVNNMNHFEVEKESLPPGRSEIYFTLRDERSKTLTSMILLNSEISVNGEASFHLKSDSSNEDQLGDQGEISLCGRVKKVILKNLKLEANSLFLLVGILLPFKL